MAEENADVRVKTGEVNLETISKAVPLGVGFFICCGSLHLSTYYKCFHINIFNYLDTTEILVTFLYLIQDIAYLIAVFIGYVLFVKSLLWITKSKADVFNKSRRLSFALIVGALLLCIAYLIKAYFIEIDSNYILKNRDWMRTVLYIFGAVAFIWITAEFEARTSRGIKNMIIFFALFCISYSVATAIERVEGTVKDIDKNSYVVLDKDTIRTTKSYIYVGRTNKYVFFFNIDSVRADVIPEDKIQKISFSYPRP